MDSTNKIFNFRYRRTLVNYNLKYIRRYIKQLVKKKCYWIMFGCFALSNKLIHALVGNKQNGYRAAVWNCARGLILSDCSTSDKFTDIKLYLQKHQLDLFGILECDLHSQESPINRKSKLTTVELKEILNIEGYKLILPQSWQLLGQARIMLYVKESMNVNVIKLAVSDGDLPSISVEVAKSKEKKTNFNFFYREFTGLNGYSDNDAQRDRLERQVNHWKQISRSGRDVVLLGDSNLCATQWTEESYQI